MGHNISQRKRRDAVLQATLEEFTSWQLGVLCGRCAHQRVWGVEELLTLYRADIRIVSLVNRLRCSTPSCGYPPSRVVIVSHRGDEIVLVGQGAYG